MSEDEAADTLGLRSVRAMDATLDRPIARVDVRSGTPALARDRVAPRRDMAAFPETFVPARPGRAPLAPGAGRLARRADFVPGA